MTQKSSTRNTASEVVYGRARYELVDWSLAPEALAQLNRLRESLVCPLMEAIGYVVETLKQNIENFEVIATNPHGRIEGLRRISNSNYETERNSLRRNGYYIFPCEAFNSSSSDSKVYIILRLGRLRERTACS